MRCSPLVLASLALAFPPTARGQNLLTNNAGFEANTGYYAPGWGSPQGSPDALPGWVITLDPRGDGYAGAATNQSPEDVEGTHFAYIYSGTGAVGLLETAPDSRAPVATGITYTLWFLARGDATWSECLATVSLVWYADQNTDATVGDPTNLDLILPEKVSSTDPMQAFHITSVAPPGARYAAVRITRPADDYAPAILDDFVIMAEPTVVSLSIVRQGQSVVLSWPRDLNHELEENSSLGLSGTWQTSGNPPRGIGATNYVDYPITAPGSFFRLVAPN